MKLAVSKHKIHIELRTHARPASISFVRSCDGKTNFVYKTALKETSISPMRGLILLSETYLK